jgi:hypothetical protein
MKKNLLIISIFILQNLLVFAESDFVGFPCNPTRFFALTDSSDVEEFEVVGNSVISHGIVLSDVPGGALAYCNNLDGGPYSPTFYSSTSTNVSHYNGTTWDTVNFTPQTYMGGCGGNGNYLYYTQPGSNHPFIYTYNMGALSGLAVNMSPAVADVAADEDGNIWYFAGSNQISTLIRQLSPSGAVIKEFNCYIDTYNAYGCFLLNGVLYLGLGKLNTVFPSTLIPITFTTDSAYVGTPMAMPQHASKDLASCNPGVPLSAGENSFYKKFVLYPNPVADVMTVSSTSSIINYTIYNISGKIIKTDLSKFANRTINISSLVSGIYFIECETVNGIIRRKFVKQ